ncbi:MAG: hypothetical protein U9P42_08580 [Candidatus Fermentibacteria bacterium]|nr:hypothetical protein [Candidatus Fermentibacteria bacterium]
MRSILLILLLVASFAAAQEIDPPRDSMDFFFGAGAWMPGLLNDDNQLEVGSVFMGGVETPMAQGDQFRLAIGGGMCNSDRENFDGITAIMLNLGYRNYPFYRPYAGARGLEPFFGVTAGGIVAWDSVEETVSGNEESSSTGGAMAGIELGARMKISEGTFFDITLGGDWVPIGGDVAGEEDLSGIRIQGSLVF